MPDKLVSISPAEFFYKFKELPGFSNELTSAYTTIRELVENSLDACEGAHILPEVRVSVKEASPIYKIRVADNGTGVQAKDIPRAFGTFLTSSKYQERQQRGLFGIGGKFALLYSQVTTQKPYTIASATEGSKEVNVFELMIDIKKNEPKVISQKTNPNTDKWHGVLVSLHSTFSFDKSLANILEYMKRTALVNPHAFLSFTTPQGNEYKFDRVIEETPTPPEEVSPHPHGVDPELLRSLIKDPKMMLSEFLIKNFQSVGTTTAKAFLQTFLDFEDKEKGDIPIGKLKDQQIVNLAIAMKLFADWIAPTTKCLSPISEKLFLSGIQSQYSPDFLTYNMRKGVTGGHPFIIEAVIGYGGKIPNSEEGEYLLHRIANKIPLIQELKSDSIYRTVRDLNLAYYRVPENSPVGFWVHLCSTKLPWKSAGKEIIAEVEEIESITKNCLNFGLKQLSAYLSKRHHADFEKEKFGRFKLYIPEIARSLSKITGEDEKVLTEKMLKLVVKEEPKTLEIVFEGEK